MRGLMLALACALLAAAACAQQAVVEPIHDGKHWQWYAPKDIYDAHKADIERLYDYADLAFDTLVRAWGLKPPNDKYALLVLPTTGGAFAAGDIGEVHAVTGKDAPGIGVCYDAYFNEANGIKGYWAYALTTHEMVNLFTGAVVSGGWPVDWWADHQSPFPAMTAVQIELGLVPEVGVHHGRQFRSDKLYGMMAKLKDQFGWALFRKAFTLAREDGIQWDWIGENPSALRTNYVCAYLQLAAPEDLSPFFTEGGVPDFDKAMVAKIVSARGKWHAMPLKGERKTLRDQFLHGKLQ